ncbi:amino acid adenylation domain-containing protein [Thermodesulfobacteriota bacterium]
MKTSVFEYLEKSFTLFNGRTALADDKGLLNFSELEQRSASLAAKILDFTESANQPVAFLLPKSKDCLVTIAAILASSNTYVPLDEKSPTGRLKAILGNIRPALVITTSGLDAKLQEAGYGSSKVIYLDEFTFDPPTNEARSLLKERRELLIDTDPAYIINTSGSTGIPKGVVISHRSIIDYIDWAIDCYGVCEKMVIGNQAPFHFDNSTLDIYLGFATGATIDVIPEMCFAFPAKLVEYVNAHGINFVFWVPSVLINVANVNLFDKMAPPALTHVLFAGEVMPNRHLNYWRKHLPDALFSNLYGPTEITVDCTYYIVDREFGDCDLLPIGIPCRNTDVMVLNKENQLCQQGEHGELCVRGSSLALGYWADPVRTAEVFVQNPLNKNYPELIYRTGDIVFTNEHGEIMFIGRKDNQIKHLGYRIELGEIETSVLGISEVKNACVLYNQDEKAITLFYEAFEGLTDAGIKKALVGKLSKHMIPTAFHRLDTLPKTPNGKIDRQALLRIMLGDDK